MFKRKDKTLAETGRTYHAVLNSSPWIAASSKVRGLAEMLKAKHPHVPLDVGPGKAEGDKVEKAYRLPINEIRAVRVRCGKCEIVFEMSIECLSTPADSKSSGDALVGKEIKCPKCDKEIRTSFPLSDPLYMLARAIKGLRDKNIELVVPVPEKESVS
jgi:hypothetical protein